MSDLSVGRGNTYRRALTIYQPDGAVYPLDGATVWLTVKDEADLSDTDDAAPIKLSWVSGGASAGITVADPASGVVTIEMTPAQTGALDPSTTYRYDVQVLKAGKVDTPISGLVIVRRDTTRRTTTP